MSITITEADARHTAAAYAPTTIGNWIAVDERDFPWNTIGTALAGSKGKGKKVDHLMTAAEVLQATGLDIDVHKVPLLDASTGTKIPRMFATCYDDPDLGDRIYFGRSVSDKYEVVPPRETLAFFDGVIAAHEGAHYSAAWNMREKAMLGVTIQMPEQIVVDPGGADDRMSLHLLGINSFDGSAGLSGMVQATRWFCMNQVTPIIGRGGRHGKDGRMAKNRFSMRHTKNIHTRTEEARALVGMSLDYATALDEFANRLHAKTMTDAQFDKFLANLAPFTVPAGATDIVKERVGERRDYAMAAWRAGHNANVTGTRWGALNVVAEFAEWGRNVKGSKRTGTDAIRQRAIGTMVHPTVGGLINAAATILAAA